MKIAKKYSDYPEFRYWADLTAALVVGWGAFVVAYLSGDAALKAIGLVVAIPALYRATSYTHELVHIADGKMPGFRIYWTLLCGIPMLAPHFLYHRPHLAHHSVQNYNTGNDVEYYPFFGNRRAIHAYYLKNLAVPVLSAVRFLILPLSLLIGGKFRSAVCRSASSMGIRFVFERKPIDDEKERRQWLVEESLTFVFAWSIVALIVSGVLSASLVALWAITLFGVLTLNTYRFMSATHLYKGDGRAMSYERQILDSVNIVDDSPFVQLIAPAGLAYHGLHHIVPFVPALRLHEVHEEVMRSIAADHFYHRINYASFRQVYGLLLSRSNPVPAA